MYFIINQVNRVVAADSNLLELLSVESMDELYTKIVLGEIEISSPLDKEVTIKTLDRSEYVFETQNIVLSGMLGDLTLVELKSDNEATQELDLNTQASSLDIQIEPEAEVSDLDPLLDPLEEEMDEDKLLAIALGGATGYAVSESLSADDTPKIDEILADEGNEGISLLNDDTPLDLGLDTLEEKEYSLDSIKEDSISLIEKDENTIALIGDNEIGLNEESISLVEPENNAFDNALEDNELKPLDSVSLDEYDNSPILIDVDKIGVEMGLSGEEYKTFLNEYIDTALSLEEDLRSKDDVKFSNAAATLSQLSKVLHLPMIEKIVGTIESSSLFEKEDHVKLLYATLARLTTSSSGEQNIEDISLSVDSPAEADNDEVNFFKKNDLGIESDDTDLKFNDNVETPSLNIDTLESDAAAPSFDIDTLSDNKNDDMINLDSTFDDVKNELNKEAGITDGLDSIVENTDIDTDKGGLIAGVASTIGLGGAAALTIDQLTEEAQEETEETIANDTPSMPDVAEEKADDNEVTIAENHPAISLKDITPIHFDFQLSQAANDLSLPVELIEEFVNDFIEQAEVETVNMLDAYDKGDLDSMQKIGHLLKGASSNLRIVPLSDTLYKIQFCEDISDMEYYIKDYWGHFISFRTQMNLMSR